MFSKSFVTCKCKECLRCKDKECSLKTLTICCCSSLWILIIIVYIILFEIHHLFCFIFLSSHDGIKPTHLCEPLINVIYAFIEIPDPFQSEQDIIDYQQLMNNDIIKSNDKDFKSFCNDKYPLISKSLLQFNQTCTNIEYVIILSQRRGGSNYFLETLSNHPQIIETGHEITMRWFHFHCTQFVNDKNKKCKITFDILNIINEWFVNKTIKSSINCNYSINKRKEIFLIKLQIEQFWIDHYADFIHYISCNNITILHYL